MGSDGATPSLHTLGERILTRDLNVKGAHHGPDPSKIKGYPTCVVTEGIVHVPKYNSDAVEEVGVKAEASCVTGGLVNLPPRI